MRKSLEEIAALLPSGDSVERLKVRGYPRKRLRFLTSVTPFAGGEQWGVHENSIQNLERAIVERVFTVNGRLPPTPGTGGLRQLRLFRQLMLKRLEPVTKMTTEQFVDTYVGRKRRVYERAAQSLRDNPISPKDAIVQAFIKDEKTNLSRKEDPCPRIIQPRTARYNLELGVYLKPLEKAIFRAINSVFHGVTVMKGLNAEERAAALRRKWESLRDPVAVLLDAKRFDQHVHVKMRDFEDETWMKCVGDDHMRRLLKWRRCNRVYARAPGGAIRYNVLGKRMSGDMDTALGNCYTMCAMTWTFLHNLGIQGCYANDGDDGVLFVERENVERVLNEYQAHFTAWGFTMTLEGVAERFEHIEFCQARPVWNGSYWRMVRDPVVCLGKDSLIIGLKDHQDVANSIGWCGLSLAGDMPIFCELYRHMISGTRPEASEFTTGMQYLARGLNPKTGPVTDESRLSFYNAFGILPDTQIAFENYLKGLPPVPGLVTPVIAQTKTILPTVIPENKRAYIKL